MNRLYDRMSGHLMTRFLYFFIIHFAFWFLVFEVLYLIWPDDFPQALLRNMTLAALLGTINTILLHGVRILSGDKGKNQPTNQRPD
jgi:hypothetical protein